jgi:hypothetical protein
MATDHFAQLFPAACAGFGLCLIGGANLLLGGRRAALRVAATLAAVGVSLGVAAALDEPGTLLRTAQFLAVGLVPCLLLASHRLAGLLSALATFVRRPAVRYSVLMIGGVGLVFAAAAKFEQAEEAAAITAESELEAMSHLQMVVNEQVVATTDRGSRVPLKEPATSRDLNWSSAEEEALRKANLEGQVIRHGGGTDRSNCHGWVFTGGKFNVPGEAVETILKENGYHEVLDPRPGDLTIYRQGGAVTHTAVVRYVSEGQPVLVEGKWGSLGVFLHPADKSNYGTEYTFYRSARPGHLLAGLGDRAPAAPAFPTQPAAPAATE